MRMSTAKPCLTAGFRFSGYGQGVKSDPQFSRRFEGAFLLSRQGTVSTPLFVLASSSKSRSTLDKAGVKKIYGNVYETYLYRH